MNKDRTYCSSYTCMIRTCGRHRCHLPVWYKLPLVWIDFDKEGCDMYIDRDRWKQLDRDDSDNII